MSKAKLGISFKPEFEQKLLDMRIKNKFIKEVRAYVKKVKETSLMNDAKYTHIHKYPGIFINAVEHKVAKSFSHLNGLKYWRDFIICGFDWNETEDKYDFWNKISKN